MRLGNLIWNLFEPESLPGFEHMQAHAKATLKFARFTLGNPSFARIDHNHTAFSHDGKLFAANQNSR